MPEENITILQNLLNNGFYKINNKLESVLDKLIDDLIINSDYDILMSNIPEYGLVRNEGEKYEKVNSKLIYDTIEYYTGVGTVNNVIQISSDKYLIKFFDNNVAIELCTLLNDTVLNTNLIKVVYIKNIGNKKLSNYLPFDPLLPYLHTDCNIIYKISQYTEKVISSVKSLLCSKK